MIPNQTFSPFPEFANNGTKTAPEDAKYSQGFNPADVLPAEWANYFFNGSTKGISALNKGLSSVETEINNVLDNRGIEPAENVGNQLLTALQSFKAEAILAAHPVGSLYWTSKNENPSVTFGGGTWVKITDKFVLAAGSTYGNGSSGGSATVTLTVANLPSHSHSMSHTHGYTPSGTVSVTANPTFTGTSDKTDGMSANSSSSITPVARYRTNMSSPQNFEVTGGFTSTEMFSNGDFGGGGGRAGEYSKITLKIDHTHSFTAKGTIFGGSYKFTGSAGTTTSISSSNTGNTGSGSSVGIMPPYTVRFCWERTA